MKIKYRKLPNVDSPTGYSWHPFLQVCLRHGNKRRVFMALVDSGAVDCIFPESMGAVLGIDVPSGRPKTYFGIAQQAAPGFLHTISLQVTGFNHWTTLEAGFVSSDIIPILGQEGFFENYQIVFERFRFQFEVYPKIEAIMRGRKRGN